MAGSNYILGVIFGILSGVLSNFGVVLEKKVVIGIPKEERDENFGKKLLKNPIWLMGFILAMIIDPIFLITAQALLGTDLGPTLVPGLMAAGLIVLAVGSAKIVGESLGKIEIFGIVLMILGILFLGFSNLESGDVDITELGFVLRMTIFTVAIIILLLVNYFSTLKMEKESHKGIVLAISSGLAFCLSNFWISLLIASIDDVFTGRAFTGKASFVIFIVFLSALAILLLTNVYGLSTLQVCFKYADASKAIPIQQVPQQIAPILVYFVIFLRVSNSFSTLLMITGAILIASSGFLLGKRQAELDEIK